MQRMALWAQTDKKVRESRALVPRLLLSNKTASLGGKTPAPQNCDPRVAGEWAGLHVLSKVPSCVKRGAFTVQSYEFLEGNCLRWYTYPLLVEMISVFYSLWSTSPCSRHGCTSQPPIARRREQGEEEDFCLQTPAVPGGPTASGYIYIYSPKPSVWSEADAYFISCQPSESGENVTEGSFKEPFLRNRKSLSFPTYLTYWRRMITRLSKKGERESN